MEKGLGAAPSQAAKSSQTLVTELVLQGFSSHPGLQLLLFGCCFSLYAMALAGNAVTITVVSYSASLRCPMYFFLCNLATMDFVCISSVLPKAQASLASEEDTISFPGCTTQLFFLVWSTTSELLLLTAMAYDGYVAACHPLPHGSRVSPQLCRTLATARGSPTLMNSIMAEAFYRVASFLLTLASCGCITTSALHICLAAGRQRAFSTCSAHLLVVPVHYSAVLCTCISLASSDNPKRSKVPGVLCTALSPTLNPRIYSLRNTEVKHALGRLIPLSRR
ncbi:Olfactory receptor 13A1 [Camelus dromedarius]|uniref:Olfactory receptor 13A1 n=1 Tax=Camelus dromedarius TaxID=9838 RepID=A0A5N4DIC1_CAMDR|nr:Olfactory receptor 13A1 [Camelus dromedarius]